MKRGLVGLIIALSGPACTPAGCQPNVYAESLDGANDDAPIDATADMWSPIGFTKARCGNDQIVGLNLNPHPGATDLVFLLEGGGACWDQETCDQGLGKAVYEGLRDGEFINFVDGRGRSGVYNRDNPDNPFRDMHFVHIPYCTGDVHGGTQTTPNDYNVIHGGYNNIGHYLKRVVPTFPEVERVFIMGMSAGGFGANINFHRIREAFGDVEAHLLIDSAPPFDSDIQDQAVFDAQSDAWALEPALPPWCSDDAGATTCRNLNDLLFRNVDNAPQTRFALITADADRVLRYFLGRDEDGLWPFLPEEDYQAAVERLERQVDDEPAVRIFVAEGQQHVFMHDEPYGEQVGQDGETLLEWIADFVDPRTP